MAGLVLEFNKFLFERGKGCQVPSSKKTLNNPCSLGFRHKGECQCPSKRAVFVQVGSGVSSCVAQFAEGSFVPWSPCWQKSFRNPCPSSRTSLSVQPVALHSPNRKPLEKQVRTRQKSGSKRRARKRSSKRVLWSVCALLCPP